MILMIDNYDSFTYNLFQYFAEMEQEVKVFRNNEITLDEIEKKAPDQLVISPGPGSPSEAGISMEAIKRFAGKIPILGVCLGHQSIGQVFGGKVVRAGRLMHGKTSKIHHDGSGLFKGIPDNFEAIRYHSLVIDPDMLPDCLEITAQTDIGEIMGVRHRKYPIEGVQFHPESVLTEHGMKMLSNFLTISPKGE